MSSPLLLVAALLPELAAAPLHHDLKVSLDPASSQVVVEDLITPGDRLPPQGGSLDFVLHAGLQPELASGGWKLERLEGSVDPTFWGALALGERGPEVPHERWRLSPKGKPKESVRLRYAGVIHHPLAAEEEAYQKGFSETPGTIQVEGAYLSGATFWVPTFGDALLTFDLKVTKLPADWLVVSQGARTEETDSGGVRALRFSHTDPAEEVFLVAGPWKMSEGHAEGVSIEAFLHGDEPALARRYIDATQRYLAMYQSILPAYPYPSFALVENFWDTGYGMPGFTLLGPRVIRFPWILSSSYPHELLHNWWGNGVFVDPRGGNWCEGLTTYMADHLFAEQRHEGQAHRRDTLRAWTDFVKGEKDFPLVEFRSRSNASTQAVGYGKGLMLFHMVRRRIGDARFLAALEDFWTAHRFERVGFEALGQAFSRQGEDLGPFFEAWTRRTGAPRLALGAVEVRAGEGENPYVVDVEVRQVQSEDPFPMVIPVLVTVEGRSAPIARDTGWCRERSCKLSIPCPAKPLRVDVDPAFDLMRTLDPMEISPSVSSLRGAERVRYVLPSAASPEEQAAWRALAEAWARPEAPVIVLDKDLEALPGEALWVLGWQNRFAGEVWSSLSAQGVVSPSSDEKTASKVPKSPASTLMVEGRALRPQGDSVVLVGRSARDPSVPLAWIGAGSLAAIPGIANKVPHYGRYTALAFAGDEPSVVLKETWEAPSSPLVKKLDPTGSLPALVLPRRKPLVELPSPFDAVRARASVTTLASEEMGGRGLGTPGLEKATVWVEARLKEAGLEPAGDSGGYRQRWSWKGGPEARELSLQNLLGRIPGSDPRFAKEPVLVMAHLDHLGTGWPDVKEGNQGKLHPGADDNASGVAVLLELARVLAAEPPRARPVLFAVTTGEEAGSVGSRHLLHSLDQRSTSGGAPLACLNLDTVGRLSEGKLMVIGGSSAREWRYLFMGVQATVGIESTMVSEPLDASDQEACIEKGIPGVQLLTGPHADWHRPSDTADRVDAEGMVKVATVAREVLDYLAERVEPFAAMPAPTEAAQTAPAGASGERPSLGTVPDFAFAGPGVRVQDVTPGSPAEKAGIKAGDVLLSLGGKPIADLRGMGALLSAHKPGERVRIELRREGGDLTVEAVLTKR